MLSMVRPTIYEEGFIEKVDEYLKASKDVWDEFHKTRGVNSDGYERTLTVKLPSREGFAKHIDVSHDALSDWEKKFPEFGVALRKIDSEQKERLINEGLGNNYNPTISKLLLSANHGVVEKQDLGIGGASDGSKLQIEIVMIDPKEKK